MPRGPRLLFVQAAYYVASGVWPLVSMTSFLKVTGPKTDLWLVRTVAVLVTAIAFALAMGAMQPTVSTPVLVLAIAAALGLILIEVVYVTRRVISRIYLADAVLEVILIAAALIAYATAN